MFCNGLLWCITSSRTHVVSCHLVYFTMHLDMSSVGSQHCIEKIVMIVTATISIIPQVGLDTLVDIRKFLYVVHMYTHNKPFFRNTCAHAK